MNNALDLLPDLTGVRLQPVVSRHIVAISGGKDSTAMALWLAENEPRRYEFVCTPTGDELPPMAAHWQRLEDILQAPIVRLPEMTLAELVAREKMLPNWRARFCTHHLKIVPFERWVIKELPAIAYVGLRADEGERVGAEYGIDLLVSTRHPLREIGWGLQDVLGYLERRGVKVPERTDCARCPLQTLYEWYVLWRDWPAIYEDACQDEDRSGHTYRSPGRDTWPASLRELAKLFAAGRTPTRKGRSAGGCKICTM